MAVRLGYSPRMLWMRVTALRDFAGGLNLRDAQGELAANENPDSWNVTLDERGGVTKRLGYIKSNPTPHNASKVSNVYYWAAKQNKITQAGTELFKDDSTTSFKTFTTTARCGFADFQGKLYFIHPIDGLFNYDGTTVTAVAGTGAPKGTTLSSWQNYLLASGDPNALARVYRSKIADGTVWDTAAGAVTNDLREKDQEPVVLLTGASGIDILGRPGLLAFKRRSAYRIYDSATLAYQTIDSGVGAASALAAVNLFGRTIVLSERGIYWTDGLTPLRTASDREEPLWTDTQVAYDQQDLWCAGYKADRVYFSLCRTGSTANDLAFEYHPLQGWLVPGSNAASCYTTYGKNAQKLLAGSPTVVGQVYEFQRGGSDDGAAIASRFQTRWHEPGGGFLSRVLRANVIGRGAFDLYTRLDYEVGNRARYPISLTPTQAVWDGFNWDDGSLWGPVKAEAVQTIAALGACRAISLRVEETSTLSYFAAPVLGTGTAPEVGAWALYGLDLTHVNLGFS